MLSMVCFVHVVYALRVSYSNASCAATASVTIGALCTGQYEGFLGLTKKLHSVAINSVFFTQLKLMPTY